MATNYPGSLDTSTQQPSPSSSTEMDDSGFEHDVVHTNHSGAIIAVETKVGTGASTPVANSVLGGTGSGTSAWTTTPTLGGLTVSGDAAFDTDTLFVDVSEDRVGIGTATPYAPLHAFGGTTDTVARFGSGDAGVYISFYDNTSANETNARIGAYGDKLVLLAGGSDRMVIKSDGDVGIGTTSPATPLHISNDDHAILRLQNEGSGNTEGPTVELYGNSGRMGLLGFDNSDDIRIKNETSDGKLFFFTNNTVRATVLADGKVGIGTDAPGQTLHVDAGTDNTVAMFKSTDTTAYIAVADSDTSSGTYVGIGAVGDALRLRSGNANHFAMDSSGNVGINDTSPSYKLDVNGTGRFTGQLTLDGNLVGTSNTNFTVGNDSGEFILFQESSNALYFQTNGTYRGYFTSGGDFVPYADSSYDLGSTSLRWSELHVDYVRAANGSISAPSLSFSGDSNTGFYITGNSGVIYWSGNNNSGGYLWNGGIRTDDGSASTPAFAFTGDSNTGIFRKAADQLGFACGGSLVGYFDTGSGGRFFGPGASTGTAIIRSTTSAATPTYAFFSDEDSGMYRHTTNQVGLTAGGTTSLIAAGGTVNTAGLSTSTLTGYKYVVRNTTYGTLYHYTSSRDFKENITNVSASDASAWIDALQPVTFNERWLQEGDESDADKAWREADVQVGFVADDVLANSTTAQFAQVEDVDGTLKGVGWKWECVIAAAVAEIKSLRTRVAELESA